MPSLGDLLDDGAAAQVVRTKINGSVETTYDTPGLFIGFTDLPDGSIAWPATGDSTTASRYRARLLATT